MSHPQDIISRYIVIHIFWLESYSASQWWDPLVLNADTHQYGLYNIYLHKWNLIMTGLYWGHFVGLFQIMLMRGNFNMFHETRLHKPKKKRINRHIIFENRKDYNGNLKRSLSRSCQMIWCWSLWHNDWWFCR